MLSVAIVMQSSYRKSSHYLSHKLTTFKSVNAHSNACSIKAVDAGAEIVGKPYDGISIMLRKDLNGLRSNVRYGDPRLLVLCLKVYDREILIINVYFPFFAEHRRDDCLLHMWKIF